MPTAHPLPQLTPQRISRIRREVAGAIWRNAGSVPVLGSVVLNDPIDVAAAQKLRFSPVRPGSHFGPPRGDWKQRWFSLDVAPAPRGVVRHLFWKCQGETTVYHRGRAWAGLDVCHASCPLPPGGGNLLLDCGTYQTAIWAAREDIGPHGLRFDGAHLADRDDDAWQAHHDIEILAQLLERLLERSGWEGAQQILKPDLHKVPPLARRLLDHMAVAAGAWDTGGAKALRRALAPILRGLPAEAWQPRATLVGHSHMDLVWMWPEREGERKGLHTISTMVRLLEEYPQFRVTWTQPALLDAVRRRAPALMRDVDRHVRAGRWEFTGGMEVEAENHIPCGEALARSLAYGQQRLARLRGGRPSTVLWLPDCFGFSACLPQLMVQAGITGFFTGKLSWSQITPFPHTSFVWRGSDGSEVVAHQAPGGGASVGALADASERDRQSGVHGEFLAWLGVGDGGGGTTETEIERVRRLADLAGVPRASWGRSEEFFARLSANRKRLPVLQGELYLEYHRGTYTTQSDFKAAYRGLERGLQAHETARAAAGKKALGFEAWKRLLFAQFHDALPGSSIQLVYDEMTPELRRLASEHRAAAARLIAGRGRGWSVLHPVPMPCIRVVDLGEGVPPHLTDAAGNSVATQKTGRGRRARTLALLRLPAAGSIALRPAAATAPRPPQAPVRATARLLDNGRVQARFDANGRLSALRTDGDDLPLDRPARFVLHGDRPANYDAWDIDRDDLLNGMDLADGMTLRVTESGPLRAVLAGETAIGSASRLGVRYILESGSRWLRVEAAVDWHEASRLLKYGIPTGFRGHMARFGTPFGSVLRPQLPGYPQSEAMWEVPGNRWAAVLDDAQKRGLAIVAEAKYGFSCRDGNLALSLLRAPKDSSDTRPQRVDQGRHVIRFAVGAHRDQTEPDCESTAAAAELLYADTIVAEGPTELCPGFSLIRPGSLVASWFAPAEEGRGQTLRLHETAGLGGVAEIRLADSRRKVTFTDLLGRRTGAPRRSGPGRWRIAYRPYQVLALRLA
jgi:alpha-mannosidase